MSLSPASNVNWVQKFSTAQFASPIVLFIFFLSTFCYYSIKHSRVYDEDHQDENVHVGPNGKLLPRKGARHKRDSKKVAREIVDFSPFRKHLFRGLLAIAVFTYAANAAIVIFRALAQREDGWWCGQAYTVYVVGNFFVYSLLLISLYDTKPSPNGCHALSWTCALSLELAMLAAAMTVYSGRHQEHFVKDRSSRYVKHMTDWEVAQIFVDVVRTMDLALLLFLYLVFVVSRNTQLRQAGECPRNREAQETAPLLDRVGRPDGQTNGISYGTTHTQAPINNDSKSDLAGWQRPEKTPETGWWEYVKDYKILFPYLWPSKDRSLQLLAALCFALIVLIRIVNLLMPIEISIITNILAGEQGPARLPWGHILIYLGLRWLQGSQGVLSSLRTVLWIPVSQYSYREIATKSFDHVQKLSLDFHIGKRTGEIISALNKGTSINSFFEQVTFSAMPMLVDLVLAIGYFMIKFDAYYALVVTIVTFFYVYITIRIARTRADMRRDMTNAGRESDAVRNDSLISHETVKYFNAETWEFERYKRAIQGYQRHESRVYKSLGYLNVTQNSIFTFGLLILTFIAAYQVSSGQRRIGDFTALLQYMVQLQSPLSYFGSLYRSLQSSMINAERLLELFKEQPTVVDRENAQPIPSCEGAINFKNVRFAYDARKPALNGLTLECVPGKTTALVGESGGGKSTVFRLLFRFYNQASGSIQVDGQDVQDVTIDSLRQQIGVVPQDTVLFNETVMYNLKYANQQATDEDVYEACRKACIHENILSFADGYNTKVGERGLRLSGGEKQRVAIARTILKDPKIIMLDEATAALDSDTEEHVQTALQTLAKGRTMLVIAHRLSTIASAHQILVIRNGKVVEKGNHNYLLSVKGQYANMWKKQVKAHHAAIEAKEALAKADKLRAEAAQKSPPGSGESSANHSDEESVKTETQERPPSSPAIERVRGFGHSRNASSSSNLAGESMKPPEHP